MNTRLYLKEKTQHSSGLVPYSYYKCEVPDFFATVPLHWHSEIEINYIIQGSVEFICGDERFIAIQGDIILILPNMLHSICAHENIKARYDTIVFSADMLGADNTDRCAAECIRPLITGNAGANVRLNVDHSNYDDIKSSVETIFFCVKGNTPQLDLLLKSELLRFFWLLWTCGDIYRKDENEVGHNEIIRPALAYINENFRDVITIEQLADTVHLSKSYFMNRFKAAAGVGAIEYITHLRIKNACELLSATNKTCAQIAYECGFQNLSNFNRQFKKVAGCTPKEYRRMSRTVSFLC